MTKNVSLNGSSSSGKALFPKSVKGRYAFKDIVSFGLETAQTVSNNFVSFLSKQLNSEEQNNLAKDLNKSLKDELTVLKSELMNSSEDSPVKNALIQRIDFLLSSDSPLDEMKLKTEAMNLFEKEFKEKGVISLADSNEFNSILKKAAKSKGVQLTYEANSKKETSEKLDEVIISLLGMPSGSLSTPVTQGNNNKDEEVSDALPIFSLKNNGKEKLTIAKDPRDKTENFNARFIEKSRVKIKDGLNTTNITSSDVVGQNQSETNEFVDNVEIVLEEAFNNGKNEGNEIKTRLKIKGEDVSVSFKKGGINIKETASEKPALSKTVVVENPEGLPADIKEALELAKVKGKSQVEIPEEVLQKLLSSDTAGGNRELKDIILQLKEAFNNGLEGGDEIKTRLKIKGEDVSVSFKKVRINTEETASEKPALSNTVVVENPEELPANIWKALKLVKANGESEVEIPVKILKELKELELTPEISGKKELKELIVKLNKALKSRVNLLNSGKVIVKLKKAGRSVIINVSSEGKEKEVKANIDEELKFQLMGKDNIKAIKEKNQTGFDVKINNSPLKDLVDKISGSDSNNITANTDKQKIILTITRETTGANAESVNSAKTGTGRNVQGNYGINKTDANGAERGVRNTNNNGGQNNAAEEQFSKNSANTSAGSGDKFNTKEFRLNLKQQKIISNSVHQNSNYLQMDKFTGKNFPENGLRQRIRNNTIFKNVNFKDSIQEISKLIISKETQTVVLRLRPKELGEIRIRLDVVNNAVNANLHVENEAVKQLIQNNLPQLKENLMQQGLALNNFNITYQNKEKQKKFNDSSKNKNSNVLPGGKIEDEDEVKEYQFKNLGYNRFDYIA